MALPISFQAFQALNNIQLDGQKIATCIPDFIVQNEQLQTKEKEGFIYQTNSIIFTFNPGGKCTEQGIPTDLMGNFVSVGMLKDKLIIALPNTDTTSALLNNNRLELPYTNESLENLAGKQPRSFLSEASIPIWIKALTFLFPIYPSSSNLLITLLFVNVVVLLYAHFRLTKATLLDCLKTLIYSISLLTITVTLLMIFLPSFDTGALIIFTGIFIFARAARGWSKISIS